VPVWGPLPQRNLRNCFRGISLPTITDTYESNGKSHTTCDSVPLPREQPPMSLHYMPYTRLQGACGWLHCTFYSVVTRDSNTARSTTDKTILRHVFHTSFTIRFPHRNGRKEVPHLSKRGDSSGIQMGSRQMTTLELDGMAMACSEGSALAQRSTP
jgi:hypothetical protein